MTLPRTLPAQLFIYYPERKLCAFESFGDAMGEPKTAVVLIPGLGDGPFSLPYAPGLAEMIRSKGHTFVQANLSSTYTGYGTSSVRQDVEELDRLLGHLVEHHGRERFFLVGHSTGSQDVLMYARHGQHKDRVVGCVLQAGVSDREYMEGSMDGDLRARLVEYAEGLINQGKGEEMMPREADGSAALTARRFLSFARAKGEDDMFSANLSDEYVKALYEGIRTPMLMVHSGADEFVLSQEVMKRMQAQHARLYSGHLPPVTIPGASHALVSPEAQEEFFKHVSSMLDDLLI
ncbi:MAG: hypothetical protein DHS80DRAFT_13190 [Piptocephalis tieghemiana]|nr:MAG: hypothetical protein DHS80DRAFT_13190 [Piptocephalis tieghemiana]